MIVADPPRIGNLKTGGAVATDLCVDVFQSPRPAPGIKTTGIAAATGNRRQSIADQPTGDIIPMSPLAANAAAPANKMPVNDNAATNPGAKDDGKYRPGILCHPGSRFGQCKTIGIVCHQYIAVKNCRKLHRQQPALDRRDIGRNHSTRLRIKPASKTDPDVWAFAKFSVRFINQPRNSRNECIAVMGRCRRFAVRQDVPGIIKDTEFNLRSANIKRVLHHFGIPLPWSYRNTRPGAGQQKETAPARQGKCRYLQYQFRCD